MTPLKHLPTRWLQPKTPPETAPDTKTLMLQRLQANDWRVSVRLQLPEGLDEVHAAQECLELVGEYPEQVSALLEAHPGVADCAIDLLPSLQEPSQPARQLALAILEAGRPIPRQKNLPESVAKLLNERLSQWGQYWDEKLEPPLEGDGHEMRSELYERHRGYPFLSRNLNHSSRNYNFELSRHGMVLDCKHLSAALADPATLKLNLQRLSRGDAGFIDRATIDWAEARKYIEGPCQVEFSQEKFGSLLAVLVQGLKRGEELSLPVCWTFSADGGVGHVMRVFIKRDETDMLKVRVYEPNVSGDTMHMRLHPEELASQCFDSYDARNICRNSGAHVLSMGIGDPQLAKALAGHFVLPDAQHQRLAFLNAMSHGNAAGMKASAQVWDDFPHWTIEEDEDLLTAFANVVHFRWGDVLSTLNQLTKSGHLPAHTLAHLLNEGFGRMEATLDPHMAHLLCEFAKDDPDALMNELDAIACTGSEKACTTMLRVLVKGGDLPAGTLEHLLTATLNRLSPPHRTGMCKALSELAKRRPDAWPQMLGDISRRLTAQGRVHLRDLLPYLEVSDPTLNARSLKKIRHAVFSGIEHELTRSSPKEAGKPAG